MKTISTRDRVHLDAEEVQDLLKAYIQAQSRREVDGDVLFQKENSTDKLTAYAHLKFPTPPTGE